MNKTTESHFFQNAPLVFTLHRTVLDNQNRITDYRLLETNPAFEKVLNLKTSETRGKLLSKWLLEENRDKEEWLGYFTRLYGTEKLKEAKRLLEFCHHHYIVYSFMPDKDHLALLFHRAKRYENANRRFLEAKDSLEVSQTFMENIFEHSPSGIIVYEVLKDGKTAEDYIIRDVNSRGLKIQGWGKKEEVMGRSIRSLFPNIEAFGIIPIFRKVWRTNRPAHYPARHYMEKGKEDRWFKNSVFKLPTQEIVVIYDDVTENMSVQEALTAEKERLRVTLHSIGDAVITSDVNGNVEIMNPVAEKITGWKGQEAVGRPLKEVFDIYNEFTHDPGPDPVERVLKTGLISGLANHTVLKTKTGEMKAIKDSAAPIKNAEGEILGVVLTFQDVTEARKREARIEYLSYKDTLTGLYNRAFFETQMENIDLDPHAPYPITVLMADIDDLKLINDVFGHHKGDDALVQIARAIKSCCGAKDVAARWGGDEFLILLPETTREEAQCTCRLMADKCGRVKIHDTNLSVSFGCATKTKKTETWDEILKSAEDIMYRRKLLAIRSYRNIILSSIKNILNEKTSENEEHGKRMQSHCIMIGEGLNLSQNDLEKLRTLSILHDIGKIGIDEDILKKPGPLTESEKREVHRHAEIGYRIANSVPELTGIAEYILSHHERWDGQGYPRGLKGEEIPLLCRILTVADAYDAMTKDRVYRKALPHGKAVLELKTNAGTQFDPKIVDIFLSCIGEE